MVTEMTKLYSSVRDHGIVTIDCIFNLPRIP